MKIDFKITLDSYNAKHNQFRIVDVPRMQYLAIDGEGDPNTSQAYRDALAALYPTAYTLKFFSKNELDRDYVVMPLEATWWADDMSSFTSSRDKSHWRWTVMIMTPEWITTEMFETTRQVVASKHPEVEFDSLELRPLHEGLCVQVLHIGPYDEEGPILQQIHDEFIPANGLAMSGNHHEIYLGDPRRIALEKLRTILRQPMVESQNRA